MSNKGYAVRLNAIDGERAATAQALSRVFGLDVHVAAQLLDSLPRVVKHDASQQDAHRIAEALRAIGAQVEVFAKPVQPARVLFVGTPEPEARAPANTNANLELARARPATATVGIMNVASLAPSAPREREQPSPPQPVAAEAPARWEAPVSLGPLVRPRSAPASGPAALAPTALRAAVLETPAVTDAQSLELAPVLSQAPAFEPFIVEHSQGLDLAEPMAAEAARARFALPADPQPSAAANGVRPASARLQPKQRRAPGVAPATPTRKPKRQTLAAHPVARFMIALGATSAVFLLALVLL